MAKDRFVMPEGAPCDVPRCGKPATDALAASSGGRVYLCTAHYRPVMDGKVPMPDVRHDYWKERKP